jgi:hypothetical protein
MNDKPTWPADEPWWQFTPRNLATGYLSLAAAALLIISSTVALLNGSQIILSAVIGVLGLLLLLQSTTGLKKLLRQRNRT